MFRKESVRILLPALAALLLLGPGAAVAGAPIKQGKYKGKLDQDSISSSFRAIQIRIKVKNGKVTLLTEPTVGRDYCVSTPVFTADGATPTKKLSRNRSFSFTRTFFGNKMDRIQGRFVGPDEIEGSATYHFFAQDLCSGGKMKVDFTAKHK